MNDEPQFGDLYRLAPAEPELVMYLGAPEADIRLADTYKAGRDAIYRHMTLVFEAHSDDHNWPIGDTAAYTITSEEKLNAR